MPKTLLTGGSGFIASHVLEYLLGKGHTVVTTVRSTDKANKIKANNPNAGDKLQFAIVEDIAKPDAFDKAIISDPPFDYVIHTASPFHFNVNDTKSDLLDPAIIGTTGILKAIKKSAPSVKRVVITSSFAAITDPVRKPVDHTYSEQDWNGITEDEALKNAASGYRASKTFAERAAWEFVEKEKPNFDLVTMNPPLVFGPIHANLQTLDGLNTSNQRVRNCITGAFNGKVAPTGVHLWVDVRDLAKAHVDALQTEGAGGKRFFVVAGHFNNNQIVEIVRKTLPQYADKLPTDLSEGGFPADGKMAGYDNSRVEKVLGIKYHTFDESIADTAKSLVPLL